MWKNRHVKLVDGTTVSLADTEDNRAHYPQHGNQAEGVGFPLARLVGVISLMCEKELWVYFLAYNLIQLLMAEAALRTDAVPRQLSFKHTLQIGLAWSGRRYFSSGEEDVEILFALIAQKRVEAEAMTRCPRGLTWSARCEICL